MVRLADRVGIIHAGRLGAPRPDQADVGEVRVLGAAVRRGRTAPALWEFSDGTMRYLLALPVSRTAIACAKFTVMTLWSAAVTGWLMGFVLALGWALGLPGASPQVLLHGLSGTAISAALLLLVTTPVALVACAGRGYLAPLATTAGIVVLGQVAAALGYGGIFPWSIPAIAAGLAPDTRLTAAGLVIAALTGTAGVTGTVMWWRSGRAGL